MSEIIDLTARRTARSAPGKDISKAVRQVMNIIAATSEQGTVGPHEADALCHAIWEALAAADWKFSWSIVS
jgi:hypothetical protein